MSAGKDGRSTPLPPGPSHAQTPGGSSSDKVSDKPVIVGDFRQTLLKEQQDAITRPSRAVTGGSPADKVSDRPLIAGDLQSLLKDQQDALKWSLALNQAITRLTDEHAQSVAEAPGNGTATTTAVAMNSSSAEKRIQFADPRSVASPIPTQTVSPQNLSKPFLSVVNDFSKFCINFSPTAAGSRRDLLKPLLYDERPASVQIQGDEEGREPSEGEGLEDSPSHMSRSKGVEQLLFPIADETILIVQDYLNRHEQTVEDLYHKTGFAQACARSSRFSNVTIVVILLNTFWIAVDTDYNKQEVLCNAPVVFQVADNLFCFYFTCELIIRLMAFKRKQHALQDPWYIFDAVLVSLMVLETWVQTLMYLTFGSESITQGRAATIFRIFRLARLTRVARTGKLLHSAPELMILAKAMFLAMRSVIAILVMLTLVIYVFAILFTQLLAADPMAKSNFQTVPHSMNFLLLQLLCGFENHFMRELLAIGWVYYVMFLLYLFIANMTIMNMLIGILCDVVAGVSEAEKEVSFVKEIEGNLEALAAKIDPDGDGRVSGEEFRNIMRESEFVQALDGAGVDVISFVQYASFVFQDGAEISQEDFTQLIVQFRGDRVATVKELVSTRKYITNLFECMQLHLHTQQLNALR